MDKRMLISSSKLRDIYGRSASVEQLCAASASRLEMSRGPWAGRGSASRSCLLTKRHAGWALLPRA